MGYQAVTPQNIAITRPWGFTRGDLTSKAVNVGIELL